MNFKYSYTHVETAELNIDDIGNCAIESCNADGEYFYLIIVTKEGYSHIIEYGPYNPDFISPPSYLNYSFRYFMYSMPRLKKIIDTYLNNSLYHLNSAKLITIEEALSKCKPPTIYIKKGFE